MAKAYITRHSLDRRKFPYIESGQPVAALSAHDGDSIDIDFTAGEAHSPVLGRGLFEITIAGADARMKIGDGATATATNGQFWADGRTDVRYVNTGERISIIAHK